ncbi:polyamine aminopropyltransferase [Brockia lithotrophica]|uniref:Polyamine aminopropyltransferase n=1 Tax=Brockia lithotrophica TaxID=933949 RepID=A0A660KT70_9BACL|nr:polyamine aminopropyltransferase [Brockia lithotrophica]RKQ83691.1 spermidine synthase [Brockia lithotrophica]
MASIPPPKHLVRREDGLWLVDVEEGGGTLLGFRIREVLFEAQTPYQHILVVDSFDYGKMLVLDGIVQTTVRDGFIYNEMIAHPPLLLHPDPRRVLIVGGGDLGAAREVLKYPEVESLVLVEIDAQVVEAARTHLPEIAGSGEDPRLELRTEDGIRYLETASPAQFDVILVDSSDPVGPAVGLFQPEFYAAAKRALRPGGILVVQSESPLYHRSTVESVLTALRKLFHTVRPYWSVVPTYAGGFWMFTLATDLEELEFRRTLPGNTRFATPSGIRAAFDLPPFLREWTDGLLTSPPETR